MGYRMAFASIDGLRVDQHFGSARYWQIYDVSEDISAHVETRKTAAKLHQGHYEGSFDHLLIVLADCDAVFVAKIGESAAALLIKKGKRVFETAGKVEEILVQITRGNLLSEG